MNSKFWHQMVRLNVTGPASFLTHTVLRLRKGSLLARYSNVFFSFFVSGAMHVVGDFGGGLGMAHSGALHFFCVQTLGIMLEDAVQALYQSAFGTSRERLRRGLGFVWVLAFLTWSTPAWVYPTARVMDRDDLRLSPHVLWRL